MFQFGLPVLAEAVQVPFLLDPTVHLSGERLEQPVFIGIFERQILVISEHLVFAHSSVLKLIAIDARRKSDVI